MMRTALIILADCREGATEHALKLQGVSMGAMATLARNGLVRVEQQTVGANTATSNLVFAHTGDRVIKTRAKSRRAVACASM